MVAYVGAVVAVTVMRVLLFVLHVCLLRECDGARLTATYNVFMVEVVCCSECNVSHECGESTPCLVQPIGVHGGEVMYLEYVNVCFFSMCSNFILFFNANAFHCIILLSNLCKITKPRNQGKLPAFTNADL